jgi:phosphatidate cytidylyltransferase
MLKTRVVTATVLLAVLLSSLLYPSPWFFSGVLMLLILAAAWEWAQLQGCAQMASIAFAAVVGVSMLGIEQHVLASVNLRGFWLTVSAAWVLGSVWALRAGPEQWQGVPVFIRLVVGYVAIVAAWMAVVHARALGLNFLLSAMALVWLADVGAYFAGRTLGGKVVAFKLAPSISPGKTWEGAAGGLFGVLALAAIWCVLDDRMAVAAPSFYGVLREKGWGILLVSLLCLTAMSVVGDLMESLVKRAAQVKDSSALLPGHGGVLDRIDALLPVMPMVMWLYSV